MKIILVGAGKVGFSIAESLASEGHDITVIDQDGENVIQISNALDVICVEGSATNPATLRDAGAENADVLIAATPGDEVNMICGIAARKLGTRHVIVRVRNPEFLSQTEFFRESLGLSVIVNPDYECAMEISRILRFPTAVRVDTFSKGSVEIIEYRVGEGSGLIGAALKELPQRFGAKVLIAVVERGEEALIPNGDFVLQEGDKLSITGSAQEIRRFFSAVGHVKKRVKSVMIMGGGRIGVYLTHLLEDAGMSVTVVDRNRSRCDELCDLIPNARVICGDATRSEVLLEEGLRSTDAFVALTGDDGDNIITSLYASRVQVPKIVAKVNREHFSELLESGGIESIVSPRSLVAQQVTRYIRAISNSAESSSVETLHRLADGKIEALELKVSEGAACVGVPLKDLRLKKGILISAVIRGSESILPNGSTCIRPGDHAVIVTAAGRLKNINEIVEN